MRLLKKKSAGISLIELVIILFIVAILGLVAMAKFHDFMLAVKTTVVKNNVATLRRGIRDFYIDQALQGVARYPTSLEVAQGVIIKGDTLPPNLFDMDGNPNNVVTAGAQSKGTVLGNGGWAYRPEASSPGADDAGEIWANTSTSGVNENNL